MSVGRALVLHMQGWVLALAMPKTIIRRKFNLVFRIQRMICLLSESMF